MVKIIFGGFLLLGVCLLLGRWIGGTAAAVVAVAINCFLLWLATTLVNMLVGVTRAGYSAREEAPVALLVFAVPAIMALIIRWKSSSP